MREGYEAELTQLRLQVELMGLRVEENLERMRRVLAEGSEELAAAAVAADDEIDAMNVSLTERCYSILARESPVAADLRLVVSVIRVIGELERIGDLCLRVVKLQPEHARLTASERGFDILLVMSDEVLDRFGEALRAWGSEDLDAAERLAAGSPALDLCSGQLTEVVQNLRGETAASTAVLLTTAGRALDRIADHTAILGSRLRYLITGDPHHLAAEVRW